MEFFAQFELGSDNMFKEIRVFIEFYTLVLFTKKITIMGICEALIALLFSPTTIS